MIRSVSRVAPIRLALRPSRTISVIQVRGMSGEVKKEGGTFSKKESYEEERYMREHEKESVCISNTIPDVAFH